MADRGRAHQRRAAARRAAVPGRDRIRADRRRSRPRPPIGPRTTRPLRSAPSRRRRRPPTTRARSPPPATKTRPPARSPPPTSRPAPSHRRHRAPTRLRRRRPRATSVLRRRRPRGRLPHRRPGDPVLAARARRTRDVRVHRRRGPVRGHVRHDGRRRSPHGLVRVSDTRRRRTGAAHGRLGRPGAHAARRAAGPGPARPRGADRRTVDADAADHQPRRRFAGPAAGHRRQARGGRHTEAVVGFDPAAVAARAGLHRRRAREGQAVAREDRRGGRGRSGAVLHRAAPALKAALIHGPHNGGHGAHLSLRLCDRRGRRSGGGEDDAAAPRGGPSRRDRRGHR